LVLHKEAHGRTNWEQIPAVELRSWDHKPSGVVSLLDMLKRYAFSFYGVMSRIESLRYEASLHATSTYSVSPTTVYDHTLARLGPILTEMRTECDKLDLTSTTDLVTHIESEVRLKGKNYTYVDLSNHLNTLSFSFSTELQKKTCFRIAAEKEKYFEKDDLFGPEVSKAFGSCADEIRNAGTCYALEQDDACVFHLMRILERSLGVLALKFGVPFDHNNWHNIIEQLEAKIRKMDATFGLDWKDKQKFYARAANQFMFFKDAWRNHVMHVRDVFDEGKALSIYNSVRGFMQALAEGGLAE
jgi:hypothetical protein